jgi:hypothetical protein
MTDTAEQKHNQPPAHKSAKTVEEKAADEKIASTAVQFDAPTISIAERRKELIAQAEANEAANDAAYEEQVASLSKLPKPAPAPQGVTLPPATAAGNNRLVQGSPAPPTTP